MITCCNEHTFVFQQRSQKYIAMLPKDKQMFAAQLRRRQLQKQLPLHDLHANFCNSLSEPESLKLQKFSNKRRLKAAGVGQIRDLPKNGDNVWLKSFTVRDDQNNNFIRKNISRDHHSLAHL